MFVCYVLRPIVHHAFFRYIFRIDVTYEGHPIKNETFSIAQ